jgi:hypothetical protein
MRKKSTHTHIQKKGNNTLQSKYLLGADSMCVVDVDYTEEKHVSNRYYETLLQCMFFYVLISFCFVTSMLVSVAWVC